MRHINEIYYKMIDLCLVQIVIRVNSPNSGCLLNIGNGPQSGPPFYIEAKGREAANQCVLQPKAAKWLNTV